MRAFAQFCGQCLKRFNPCPTEAHSCAGGMQRARNIGTNATRGTGNQRIFSSQIKHIVSSLLS
jgi:hypothetical protein